MNFEDLEKLRLDNVFSLEPSNIDELLMEDISDSEDEKGEEKSVSNEEFARISHEVMFYKGLVNAHKRKAFLNQDLQNKLMLEKEKSKSIKMRLVKMKETLRVKTLYINAEKEDIRTENAQLRRQVKAMTNSQNETLIKDLRKENGAIKRKLKDQAQASSEVQRNWGDSRVRILSLESQLKLSKHRRKTQLTEADLIEDENGISNKDYREMYMTLLKRCKETKSVSGSPFNLRTTKTAALHWMEERVKERRKQKAMQENFERDIKQLKTKMRDLQQQLKVKNHKIAELQKINHGRKLKSKILGDKDFIRQRAAENLKGRNSRPVKLRI